MHGKSGEMFDLTRSCFIEKPPSSRASVLNSSGAMVWPNVDLTWLGVQTNNVAYSINPSPLQVLAELAFYSRQSLGGEIKCKH